MVRTPSQPVRGFIDMMSEMERIRNLGRYGYEHGQPAPTSAAETAWAPVTDMFARGSDLVIATELAGVPAADIEISVSDGVLTISGERQRTPDGEDMTPFLRERHFGAFRRSLALPDGVDEQAIVAGFDNGVVTVTVPGAAEAPASRPHHIPIVEVWSRDDDQASSA